MSVAIMHPEHNCRLLNAFHLRVFLLDYYPNVAFFEIFNNFLLIFVCKGHTSIPQDGLSQKPMLLVGLFVIPLVHGVNYFCPSVRLDPAVPECVQGWKAVRMPWCWSGWVGGGVVQLHRTKHGASDVCFVAQHTAAENVQ